jgi:hypothetical protein
MLNCKAPKPLPTNLVLFSKNHAKCYQKHLLSNHMPNKVCIFQNSLAGISLNNFLQVRNNRNTRRCSEKGFTEKHCVRKKHPSIKLNLIFRHPVIHKFNVFCWLEEWFLFFFQSPVFFVNKDPCQIHHHCLSNNYFQLNFVSHLLHLCA